MIGTNHPITEFASLAILPPHTTNTPELKSGFIAGSKAQSAWSGYPLHFFQQQQAGSGQGPSVTLYIIAGWQSAEAHHAWIASPVNQELMSSFGDGGQVGAVGLVHLGIDFTKMSFEECRVVAWRKRSLRSASGASSDDWEGTPVPSSFNVDAYGDEGLGAPNCDCPASFKARILWSYRGRVVDVGAEEEYELIAYSAGELPATLHEDYTLIHRLVFV